MTTLSLGVEVESESSFLAMPRRKDLADNGTFQYTRSGTEDTSGEHCSSSSDHNNNNDHQTTTSSSLDEHDHKTTFWQTYVHLLKGYIGCGVLSLPWAVSQLGVPVGCAAIFIMAYWSSYNCWTVVKLKRYIERSNNTNTNNSTRLDMSETQSERSVASSVTYPDVGDWAHGTHFHSYVTACICVQQLAICTVFLSFIAENVHAVLVFLGLGAGVTHVQVLSMALPLVMALCCLPTLRHLAPVMAAATMLILFGFVCLAGVGFIEWEYRPLNTPPLQLPKAPLALCAILYSFEGICLVLPIESAMKEPKEFKKAFVWSMSTVAGILAAVAGLSVVAFGFVSNGSITAFLLEEYGNDESHAIYLMMVNTAVSLSILLTYPLQLFPAVELIAPMVAKYQLPWMKDNVVDELDLDSFEPLPPIDEHDVASVGSLPSRHHDYAEDFASDDAVSVNNSVGDGISADRCRVCRRLVPEMHLPGDSLLLRAILVLLTYAIASLVPNVENLISLAGAVAGSSTALLIPPILELAWIRQLQKGDANLSRPTGDIDDSGNWILATGREDKFLFEKIKSWILLIVGGIFAALGTYASISDIVRLYKGP